MPDVSEVPKVNAYSPAVAQLLLPVASDSLPLRNITFP
jgi:hypothetical protein